LFYWHTICALHGTSNLAYCRISRLLIVYAMIQNIHKVANLFYTAVWLSDSSRTALARIMLDSLESIQQSTIFTSLATPYFFPAAATDSSIFIH